MYRSDMHLSLPPRWLNATFSQYFKVASYITYTKLDLLQIQFKHQSTRNKKEKPRTLANDNYVHIIYLLSCKLAYFKTFFDSIQSLPTCSILFCQIFKNKVRCLQTDYFTTIDYTRTEQEHRSIFNMLLKVVDCVI